MLNLSYQKALENCQQDLYEQLIQDIKTQKEANQTSVLNLQSKIDLFNQRLSQIENRIESLTQAFSRLMEEFKKSTSQFNDSVNVIEEHQQALNHLDLRTNAQSQQISNIESALTTLMELMQPKEIPLQTVNNPKFYKVQPGDTLEKIAKQHKVTVQQIKNDNQLNNDRINVGQNLKICF